MKYWHLPKLSGLATRDSAWVCAQSWSRLSTSFHRPSPLVLLARTAAQLLRRERAALRVIDSCAWCA
eukprot:5822389-Pleurochrysis_carterae.AAC.4